MFCFPIRDMRKVKRKKGRGEKQREVIGHSYGQGRGWGENTH